MIYTVFNSFFRTLGRILCYVFFAFIIALIIGLVKVKADTRSNNWVYNVKYLPSNSAVVNWSSATDFTYFTPASIRASSLFSNTTYGDSASEVYNSNDIIYYMDDVVLGSNGRSFGFSTPYRLFKNQYHAITTYICYSGGDMPQVTRIGAGDSYNTAFSGNVKYQSTSRMYLNYIDLAEDNVTTLGFTRLYCGYYLSIIQPIENSYTFNLRMDGVSTKHSYFLMGIDAFPLANADSVTASEVESIVKNSGLASAYSVDQVNKAVQQVQEETKKVNDTISSDEVDDSGGKSFFDNFTTSDNGGISSLVTAPLQFINRATDKCSPISIPLYDKKISLPCGDTLFWNKTEVKPLRDVINTIVGGVFIYFLLGRIFRIIQNIKNPLSDDESEVPIIEL